MSEEKNNTDVATEQAQGKHEVKGFHRFHNEKYSGKYSQAQISIKILNNYMVSLW